jgi:hypothetical protein
MQAGFFSVKDQWTGTLSDGTEVSYTYERLLYGLASARARASGSNILYVRNNVADTLGRREVEALFEFVLTQQLTPAA